MRFDRRFIVVATLYAILGVWLGAHMGRTGDHSQFPTHAHIMLLGFVSNVVFGLVYKMWPAAQDSRLVSIHFWLHQIGTPAMLTAMSLEIAGGLPGNIAPVVFGVSEAAILVGYILFAWNFWSTGKEITT